MPSEPPETTRFENGEFLEVAVDGTVVLRIEQLADISMSPVEDAVIGEFLRTMYENGADEFEEENGMSAREAIEQTDPEIEMNLGNGWESLNEEL